MNIKAYISSYKNISFYACNDATKEEEYIFQIAKKTQKKEIDFNFNKTNYRFYTTSIFQDFFMKPLIDILNANFTNFDFKKRKNYSDEIEIIPKTEETLKETDIAFSVEQATLNFNIAVEAAIADRLAISTASFFINEELIVERKIFNKEGYTETDSNLFSRGLKGHFLKKKEIKENIGFFSSTIANIVIKGVKLEDPILNEENPIAYVNSSVIKGYISKETFLEILNLGKYEICYADIETYSKRIYKLYQGSDLFPEIKMLKETK